MENKIIYLAGGCFWGIEAYFSRVKGVVRTIVGYANGKTKNPTYEEVCSGETDFVECVLTEYNPEIISLEKILNHFFNIVDPTTINKQGPDTGTQYRSGIYHIDKADEQIIKSYIQKEQEKYEKKIVTEVLPLKSFYDAEAYHQKYLDKNPNGYCHIDLSKLNNIKD